MSRLAINKQSPEGYKAVGAFEAYVQKNVDHVLLDLVKLRASQLNGCAFCVDMHSSDLQKNGVPVRKIFAVAAWKEAPFFSDKERAALALTEEVTLVSEQGVTDQTWDEASKYFSDKELSDLVLAIAAINVWNRIGVSTHLAPPPLD
ncbi:alkylhydroperoxidase AhpD family core domain-containing protein [Propionibacterium cyclohexanicum]|uniref:Alkylhydroperoxidase AhpD family core domain-containing protein n=1 Tax=Propionibacterium cyclohexanicum TaxID=64702 RepID=A0A1H9U8W5_9ACTN|nr:carboxymuconolactone decarboxylase family protein [Propionibacterium cyclohexanicum]SES05779.1 alkylhydroperoxidase AhpD family core domain-containing protein [Propionibacterium cyclohexanicum]